MPRAWLSPFLALLAVALLAGARPAYAQGGFNTENYEVRIQVKPDRSLAIVEILTVRFTEPRHGLIRWIPVQYPDRRGGYRSVSISEPAVRMARLGQSSKATWNPREGQATDVRTTPEGNRIQFRIGSANTTLTGRARYTIRYTVSNALTDFEDGQARTELYWNAIPTEWATPISKARVTIDLPPGPKPTPEIKAFVGSMGSTTGVSVSKPKALPTGATHRLWATLRSDSATKGHEAVFESIVPLKKGEGITTAVAVSKGTVQWIGHEASVVRQPPPESFSSPDGPPSNPLKDFLQIPNPWSRPAPAPLMGFLPAIVGIGLVAAARWVFRRPDAGPIVTRFDPPANIGPAESGVLVDQTFHVHDLVAGIVSLAQKGAVWIKGRTADEEMRIEVGSWQALQNLSPLEWEIASRLDSFGPTVRPSHLYGKFAYSFGHIVGFASEWTVSEGYYRFHTDGIQILFATMTTLGAIIATVLTFLSSPFIAPLAGLVGVGFGLFGFRSLHPLSMRGSKALNEVLGVREFILRAKKEEIEGALQGSDPKELYERLLPYAIAFGLGKRWASQFDGFAVRPPDWYEPGEPGLFNSQALLTMIDSDLSRSESYWAAARYEPRPASSWTDSGGSSFGSGDSSFSSFGSSSGGSDFSGGGSSGGGGGGGGGDSW